MTTLSVERVSVSFDGARVVDDVSLRVESRTWVALIGPNGAGKTSLLRALAGLLPYQGRILIDGDEVADMPRRRVARSIAYVPQRPVIPAGMPLRDYVVIGRTAYVPYLGSESSRDLAVVDSVLERLELGDLATRLLGSLSGGELQRVVLARALAQEAPILLLDEPTAALDVGHQQQVLELVDRLRVEHGLTVVTAMHDLTLAGQFSDSLLLLDRGRAVATGSARTVLDESVIAAHYAANVQILRDTRGDMLVVPRRVRNDG